LLGGLACFIPNALFALRLLVRIVAGKPASAAGFLIGELIKLGASIALLVLGVYLAQSWLVWPALLFGLVMVLKSYVLLLIRGKST
jgi:ATP synthase protein I